MSTRTDIFGQDTTLATAAGLEAWNAVLLGVMSHGDATPTDLARLIAAEPDCAIAHTAKGLFCMLAGRREMAAVAIQALHDAQRLAENATARERRYVDALAAWITGSPSQSVQILETVLADAPQDTFAMKMSHAIRFVLGDHTGMLRSIDRVLPAYDISHPGRGYLLGCHAFALEENGHYARAEAAGREGLLQAPDDAWGLHAVAHVLDMTCDSKRGLDWLTGREAAWAHCNNFRFHIWWHKALMLLDLGRVDEVFDLYDTQVRADQTDDYRDISNGTSLLMRLELEGHDVGDRWDELSEISAKRTEDGCLIFADLHYLLALEATNDAARPALVGRIQADAQTPKGDAQMRMANPGVAAALGLEAFTEGNYSVAFDHLFQARRAMQTAGGSHAQRDVFERITIDAGLRAGQIDRTEQILDARQDLRGGNEDSFARARRELISDWRNGAEQVPAQ